jgi:hypothetical protein
MQTMGRDCLAGTEAEIRARALVRASSPDEMEATHATPAEPET